MGKIKIIREKIKLNKSNKQLLIRIDKDGNRYYRETNDTIVRVFSKKSNLSGIGLSIDDAYCNMVKSFDIPKRLT